MTTDQERTWARRKCMEHTVSGYGGVTGQRNVALETGLSLLGTLSGNEYDCVER